MVSKSQQKRLASIAEAAATQPRFIKVSAAGILVPADATDWVAIYDSLQQLTFTRSRIPGGTRTWKAARTTAAKLDLCGWTDWRLGELEEWQRVFDYRVAQVLRPDLFDIASDEYASWTGTPVRGDESSGNAWFVRLLSGVCGWVNQSDRYGVRVVRAGQLPWPSDEVAATYAPVAA